MADGKQVLIGLDHAGNNSSLGLFTDIYHGSLDSRKPNERGEAYKDESKPAKPRKCPKCHQIVPPGVRTCPSCSERMPLHTGITAVDGRLVEISSIPKPKPNPLHQQWYSELLHIGRKAGYKDGWASYKLEARFGIKPTGLKKRGKSDTSEEVKTFVREQRKLYLASKVGIAAGSQSN